MECDEFQVYFQPIVDVTGKENVCIGAEALVRMEVTDDGDCKAG